MLDDKTSTKPRNMSLKAYRKMKLKMLEEFSIRLTAEQKAHVNSLQTEIQIDNFCITVIRNHQYY
jgi:hypothetical protein